MRYNGGMIETARPRALQEHIDLAVLCTAGMLNDRPSLGGLNAYVESSE